MGLNILPFFLQIFLFQIPSFSSDICMDNIIISDIGGSPIESENIYDIDCFISTTQNDTQSKISSKNASVYINEILTVCGPVVDSRYASASKGQPTFLNFDYPYPNHTFTIVIWGQNRTNFSSPPEKMYMSKNVCIDGYIDSYKGKPQIEATSEIVISVR